MSWLAKLFPVKREETPLRPPVAPKTNAVHPYLFSVEEARTRLTTVLKQELSEYHAKRLPRQKERFQQMALDAMVKIRLRVATEEIDKSSREFCAFLLFAKDKHTGYLTRKSLTNNSSVTDVDLAFAALFFDVLQAAGIHASIFPSALSALRRTDQKLNQGIKGLLKLSDDEVAGARAVLTVISYFAAQTLKPGASNSIARLLADGASFGTLHPEVVAMLHDRPELASELITHTQERNLSMSDIDAGLFLRIKENDVPALNEGVL